MVLFVGFVSIINAWAFQRTIFQTEAERRNREPGVKQSMEILLRSCMYVYMYICMYVGMYVWYLELAREPRHVAQQMSVSKCKSPERALLRHHIIRVRLLKSARRAKMPK